MTRESQGSPPGVLAPSSEVKSSPSTAGVLRPGIQAIGYSYSGPLPPPNVLREFEQILPGSAERIFTEFEKQAAHRRLNESTVVQPNAFAQKVGASSAALIGIAGVSGGIWLAAHGRSLSGLGTLFAAPGSIVAIFFYQRHVQDSERAEKRRNLPTGRP